MLPGTDNAYKLAKKYKIKTAFGTDALFDPKLAERQGTSSLGGRLVYPRRGLEDGNVRQRRVAGPFPASESLA
jgi:hypothetical protein